MKSIKNKKIIFIIVFLLVISSTIAFLYSTDTFQNIFVAASYKVTVVETFESPDNWKPGDTTPKTVTLKNEGTVPIKVRVKLEEEWKDSNNQDLPLQYNDENVAIINFSNEEDYIFRDGYYYYDLPLEPGEITSSIIESVTFNPNYSGTITCVENNSNTHNCSSSDSGYEGGTYKLTITIEGVQEDYYVQAWGLSGLVERPLLYNILRDETENNGLAREYSGTHHDSFTEEPSQKIYHWYASTDSEGTEIQDKNNVIFGDQCWQMIRTTDTGGVKMIYNGEVENNQCVSNRSTHVGYIGDTSSELTSNYWYGTDYEYDSVNNVFSLSGIKEQATYGPETYESLEGKYTCKSTLEDATCSSLYLVVYHSDISQSNWAVMLQLKPSAHYSQIGKADFATNGFFNTYVSGDSYRTYLYNYSGNISNRKYETLFTSYNLGTTYWYADSISYDSSTNKYSLINPYQGNQSSEYPNMVGKYTFIKTSQTYTSSTVYYIAGINGNTMYYSKLSDGELLNDKQPLIYGDSLTDNGNGTYTINNPSSITLIDWYTNYENYKNKYICNDGSYSCQDPRYIVTTAKTDYGYLDLSKKITIAKSRNGLNLIDTLTVGLVDWYNNYSTYNAYKYTCGDDSSVCTESNLKMITSFQATSYFYIKNLNYGTGVTWDGTKYTLDNTIGLENYEDKDLLSTHHYTCSDGAMSCTEVQYIYMQSSDNYIIILENGDTNPIDYFNNFNNKNTNESLIKMGIDAWYKKYMLDYDGMIEDIIFCNDRSVTSIGGWDPNGGKISNSVTYRGSDKTNKELNCPRLQDQLSMNNQQARLNYKVGLLTMQESNALNNDYARKTGENYYLITPDTFRTSSYNSAVSSRGNIDTSISANPCGVRPAISLKPGTEFESGDGSMANPYIVKMN